MIRNPINIYPYNNPIDASKENIFYFNFSGDKLGMYRIKIRDLDTNEIVYTSSAHYFNPDYKYNNDLIEIVVPPTSSNTPNYINGRNYTWYIEMSESNSLINFVFEFKSLEYYFRSLKVPSVVFYINGVLSGSNNIIDSRKLSIKSEYSQEQNVSIKYYSFYLKDINDNIVDKKEKIFSSNIFYEFDGLFTNSNYIIEAVIVTQEDQVINEIIKIYVNYDNNINFVYPPMIKSIDNKNAIEVKWVKNKIANGYSDGEYELVNDTYVHIGSGSITWDKISTYPILIDSNNYGFSIKTIINSNTTKILDFNHNNITASIYVRNGSIYFREGDTYEKKILNILNNQTFLLQQESSVPINNTEYIWYADEEHVWNINSSTYWMITPYYEKEFTIIINKNNGVITVDAVEVI